MRELGIGFAYFTPKKGRNRDAGLQHPTAQLQDPGQRRRGGAVQGPEVRRPTSVNLTDVLYSQSAVGGEPVPKVRPHFGEEGRTPVGPPPARPSSPASAICEPGSLVLAS